MKHKITLLLLLLSNYLFTQITVEKYDVTIESTFSDTLQKVYSDFLNSEVAKVSIVRLEKKYSQSEYVSFLRTRKFYQPRKKWIKDNSHEESIIIEGDHFPFIHFDSVVFERKYLGVDKEFIKSEHFLDSTEIKLALSELFNGEKNEIVTMCYLPRHAVLFYNDDGKISGIFEICFACNNVKIGIVGTTLIPKSVPYIQSLFTKYRDSM